MTENPTHAEAREKLLADDPELRAEYDELEPAYLVARELLRVRSELGISQAELARRVGTAQSVISRLENMEGSPNLRTVVSLAKALGRHVELRFVVEPITGSGGFAAGAAELSGRGSIEAGGVVVESPIGRAVMAPNTFFALVAEGWPVNAPTFTQVEHAVLDAIAEGKTTNGIADALGVTSKAAQKHLAAILQKVAATSAIEIHRSSVDA